MTKAKFERGRSRRRGTTLFEVLLASAVFFAALAVVSQIMEQGTRAGLRAELETQAAIRCQTAMADALQELEQAGSMPATRLVQDVEWDTQIKWVRNQAIGLDCIEVRVTHRRLPQLGRFVLSRLVPPSGRSRSVMSGDLT